MSSIRILFKKAFASVTIMVIPHDSVKALNLKVSAVGLLVSIMLSMIGAGTVICLAIKGLGYRAQHQALVEKLNFYSGQFYQWSSTAIALKTVEREFQQLFSLKSKEDVLEHLDASSVGSIEIPDLILELKKTTETVEGIKTYLNQQRNIYVATPRGYPVQGEITSGFGKRIDPLRGREAFHSGTDISCSLGSPIRATADGVVSHSGWTDTSGNVVVLEHGCGFSTVYAHNRMNAVKFGQRVKRGDIIGYVGSTGRSTGPHVHYEVWKNRKSVDAQPYLQGRT